MFSLVLFFFSYQLRLSCFRWTSCHWCKLSHEWSIDSSGWTSDQIQESLPCRQMDSCQLQFKGDWHTGDIHYFSLMFFLDLGLLQASSTWYFWTTPLTKCRKGCCPALSFQVVLSKFQDYDYEIIILQWLKLEREKVKIKWAKQYRIFACLARQQVRIPVGMDSLQYI